MVAAMTRSGPRLSLRLPAGKAGLAALCLVLLALAWLVTPLNATPPLYDGLGFPDEPYRYVTPPPGYPHTLPPDPGEDDQIVVKGVPPQLLLPVSDENGPQVQAGIPAAQLSIPAGTTQLVAKATPMALTGSHPLDGVVWGNVYRIVVTSDRGPVAATGRPTGDSVVDLRAPTAQQPPPVIEYRPAPAAAWRDLHTTRIGNDIYQAPLPGLGDYVLVRPTRSRGGTATASGAAPTGGGHGGSGGVLPWALGGAFAALCAAIGAVRLRRARSGELDRA
jgi:hypothetical protein